MASQDLLEMLGSGAEFGGKVRRKEDGRRRGGQPKTSINFFHPAVATSGKKRRRESDGEKEIPTEPVSGSGHSCLSPSGMGAKPCPSSTSSSNEGGVALFRTHKPSGSKTRRGKGVLQDTPRDQARASQVHTEEVACFRKRMGIRVKGINIADPMETFGDMPEVGAGPAATQTRRTLLKNVEESSWKEPTPVQMQAVPVLVAGRDLLAAAPTGSGKTAAFVIPMIIRLGVHEEGETTGRGVRGLLLAPTRELAAQIHRDVVRLSHGRKLRVCLLTKAGAAKAALATSHKDALAGYDIVVTTPMRLVALLREGVVSLANVEMVVLDEADKLFDAGTVGGPSDKAFVGQVDEVLNGCSHQCVQRALFSATIGYHVSRVFVPAVFRLLDVPDVCTVQTANPA